MNPSFLAVGIDAGGTMTRAALSRDGVVVREAAGPPANASVVGVDDAADAILTTIRRLLEHERPHAIAIGAAGAGRPAVARRLEALVASAFAQARVVVGDDAAIALRGAIATGPGVVLIAGTGSLAYAERGERCVRVGGLGYLAGDEGSAYAIGMAAVRLYGRVLDGRRRADETTDLVARALAAPDRDAYLAALYDAAPDPAAIAALAPSVIAFAGKGNRGATQIVQQAANDLGELVRQAVHGAGFADESPTIALAGGLLRDNSLLTFLLEARIVGDVPGASIVRGGDGAVTGAVRLAEALCHP